MIGGVTMCALEVNLRADEEILSEADWAVLTNQRLVAALNRKDRTEITDEADISDVVSYKKSNGGQESRLQPGLMFLGAGAAITVLQIIFATAIPSQTAEIVLFLLGAVGILVGFYLVIGSLMRIKPFTVIVFTVVGSRDIPVHFAGQDNPEADRMINLFTRTKRGI
ncbi:MAG: hypothetical protein OXI16_03705 [Chloroflexota bacterium]|nr:hypothetical protein [Chloroflexota bacterium]MCY3638252.1 hypothetical protein [Chloroflexota bacterium]MDE2686591.1 hypothetical protein [Chloroflexota bacterium]